MAGQKLYVLDTNVLIHDPRALLHFTGASVGIPLTVIEELDHFKKDNSQRGFTAREAIRILDSMRARGSLREGVRLEHGGEIRVLAYDPTQDCPQLERALEPDNKILSTALCAKLAGYDVEFITKDLNMRVKADALGLHTIDYLRNGVTKEEFYRGWRTVRVPAVQLKQPVPEGIRDLAASNELMVHEYLIVEAQHNEFNYRVYRYEGGDKFIPVNAPALKWAIEPRNVQQLMALHMLLDDSIPLVTLMGPAGTGKTLLALVAALYKVLVEDIYTKLLVSRPIIPLGPDIGYLPGELQEKLYNWMQPVYDNMELIAHIARGPSAALFREDQHMELHDGRERQQGRGRGKRTGDEPRAKKNGNGNDHHAFRVEQLVAKGKLSLEAITYMRGRSIPYRYIFIDEVQNLTPHEVKTIVSRVGDGSKIVLAGDPYQIDSPYLDFSSNGLMVLTDRFKGQQLFGTVFLENSERSTLSKLAGELL